MRRRYGLEKQITGGTPVMSEECAVGLKTHMSKILTCPLFFNLAIYANSKQKKRSFMDEKMIAKFEEQARIIKALSHPSRLIIIDELKYPILYSSFDCQI